MMARPLSADSFVKNSSEVILEQVSKLSVDNFARPFKRSTLPVFRFSMNSDSNDGQLQMDSRAASLMSKHHNAFNLVSVLSRRRFFAPATNLNSVASVETTRTSSTAAGQARLAAKSSCLRSIDSKGYAKFFEAASPNTAGIANS